MKSIQERRKDQEGRETWLDTTQVQEQEQEKEKEKGQEKEQEKEKEKETEKEKGRRQKPGTSQVGGKARRGY